MRKYEEPKVMVIKYDLLEDVELNIEDTLSSFDQGDGEEFGF
jgi:hypothetical protein